MAESHSMLSSFLSFYFSNISDAKTLSGVFVLLEIYALSPEIRVILVNL